MDIDLFFRTLVIGFSIAAPVGPIGVLCIRRSLAEGWLAGLLTGLGAATADACYGAIAGFGLTLVSDFLVSQQLYLKLLGGLFLCYLGVKTWRAKPAREAAAASGTGLIGAYGSTVLLTLTNPLTILAFAAVFTGIGFAANADHSNALLVVLGVFSGSALWWLTLSSSVSFWRSRFDLRYLEWLNRISGLILLVFGIISLSSISFSV
jgi:threonine/homoserine/homoserine lactone efflux protein